jgi:D-alanyl-D-alanine carboxypeptidase (penicillin-binding protein 5/6)
LDLRRRSGIPVVVLCCAAGALCGGLAETASAAAAPSLNAHAAILIEEKTGQRLFGLNPDQQLAIASTTKLMTALVVLEHASLGAVFTEPQVYFPPVDSQIGLTPGERMNVHDLMLAMLLPSADDAAEDLAYGVGRGSVTRFIAMMNARAQRLGLTHTHYSTPIGLDTPGNYSSPSDLVKLARFLLTNHPFFAHAVSLSIARLVTGDHQRVILNRNTLVGRVPWINGVKTGHTRDAGYVLVGSGTRDGMTLVSAVLGTPDESTRNADTLALLDYGFASFRLVEPVRTGEVVARLPVKDQPNVRAVVIAARTVEQVVARPNRVTTRLQLPRELAGPLKQGTVVGSMSIIAGGRTIARVPLLLRRSLAAVSAFTLAARFLGRPSTLLVLVVLLFGGGAIAIRRRLRIRGSRTAGKAGGSPSPAEPTEPA